MPSSLDRRQFLQRAAALPVTGALAASCGAPGAAPAGGATPSPAATPGPTTVLVPKVNGGINVHPLRRLDRDPAERDPVIIPELVALQLRAVYELGFDGMRISAPFGDRGGFLAAVPYVRAARALGIDAVVVLTDFAGLTLARALHDERRRPVVLRLYERVFAAPPVPVRPDAGGLTPGGAGRIAFQILNEPSHFLGVPPDVYVRELLWPCYSELTRDEPEVIVVAAGEIGNVHGALRVRAMIEAGLEDACDRIAYHVYSLRAIPLLEPNVRGLVWVTESGAAGTPLHLPWVRDTFPEIQARIPDVSRIFYYDLFDFDRGLHRLIDIRPAGLGYEAVVESRELHAHFTERVEEAAAGQPLAEFETLIPDIRAYFATPADVAAYEAALEA